MEEFHPLISAAVKRVMFYDGEDTIQLVYEKLIKNNYRLLKRFDGCYEQFLVYLKKISQQTALNSLKKTGRYNERAVSLDAFFESPADGKGDLEGRLLKEESIETFRREIAHLELKYREVISLLSKGYRYKEIAEILGIPLNTALTRGNRAKKMLKERPGSEIKLLV